VNPFDFPKLKEDPTGIPANHNEIVVPDVERKEVFPVRLDEI
jgi:hypothetical protein